MRNKLILKTTSLFLLGATVVVCGGWFTGNNYYSDSDSLTMVPEVGEVPSRVYLEQNWSDELRNLFWFTSQGSRIIPYSWFAWLEQANNQELFRSTAHMESLRYLPMKASTRNPAGLPVGFAIDTDKDTNTTWVGLTCAACHSNQLDYNGTKMLIEGAPTLANFVLFYSRLTDALNATNGNDEKFSRFAHNVLGEKYSESAAKSLRKQLAQVAIDVAKRQVVNELPSDYPKDFTSYARLDAFGNIQNAASAFALNDLNNNNPPTAPVSYPFLWGTHQSDVVQWNASAPNTPVVGPLVRNIGEVIGVFGGLTITKAPWYQRMYGKTHRYRTSVDMMALGRLESWVKTLRSPAWPEEYLPAYDTIKVAAGEQLYEAQCASCHQMIPRSKEGENYVAIKTPLDEVGTDSAMAWNTDYHMAKSLTLEGTRDKIIIGDKFEATTPAIGIAINGVVGWVLRHPRTALKAGLIPEETGEVQIDKSESLRKSIEDYVKDNMKEREDIEDDNLPDFAVTSVGEEGRNLTGLVYKARPLNGIWATAPYLHNGSVPNLWELLQAPEKRATTFWVGSREFDPKHVGYVTTQGLNEFHVLNAQGKIQLGNSNLGHDYGTGLTDEQKWNLIEYMKTL